MPTLAGCRSFQNPEGQTATLGGPTVVTSPQSRPHFQHQELLPRWRLRLEPQAQPRTLTLSWVGAITSCGLGFLTGRRVCKLRQAPRITASPCLECISGSQVSITGYLKHKSFALVGETSRSRRTGPSTRGQSFKSLLQTLSPHCVLDTGLHLRQGLSWAAVILLSTAGSVLPSLLDRGSHLQGL